MIYTDDLLIDMPCTYSITSAMAAGVGRTRDERTCSSSGAVAIRMANGVTDSPRGAEVRGTRQVGRARLVACSSG